MKAIVLDAEWAPRDGAIITPKDTARKWAPNANFAYRHPTMDVQEVDDPREPAAGEVIIKVAACGICGSDVHLYQTDDAGYILLPYHVSCPVVIGHELAGTVVLVGEGVTSVEVGDLVTVEEIQYCGRCHACRGGFYNSCEQIEDIGFTLNGGFAEYVRVPEKAVWSLNALLDLYGSPERALEVGSMCEPVSVAYEAMFTRAHGFQPGAAVAVFGAGPIGLASVALAAAAGGATIVCVETVPERRAIAEKLGATHTIDPNDGNVADAILEATHGIGVGMAVEASGAQPEVMPGIEESLAIGGKATIIGMDPRAAQLQLIRYQLKGASLYGSVGHCGGWDFPNVINLMASGRIRMEHAVTKRTDLDGMVDALRSMADRTDGKILIKP